MSKNKTISPQRHEVTTNDLHRLAVASINDQRSMTNEQKQGIPKILIIDHCSLIIERHQPREDTTNDLHRLTGVSATPNPPRPSVSSASSVVNNSSVVKSVKTVANIGDQRSMNNDQQQGIPKILIIDHCSLIIERHQPREDTTNDLLRLTGVSAIPNPPRPSVYSASSVVNNSPIVKSMKTVANIGDQRPMTNDQ